MIPVLMLHHVAEAPLDPPPLHPDSYLPRAELARHLDALGGAGYRTLTLAEAARAGGEPAGRSVVLTFDDGCRCFAEHALPELAARGMTATVFAVSDEVGGENRWDRGAGERRERLMSAAELRQIAGQGIEVGSHGRTHLDLTTCSPEELEAETAGSRRDLAAALGAPILTFSYPYGRWNERARAAVRTAGYEAAVSIEGHGPAGVREDELSWPRSFLTPGESRFELLLKASGRYRLWKRLPRLGVLAALRRAASGGAR
ncbi:MAG TPA: polysaccharide deacetylase family protein [Thermoanaerobaculia bacterium]